MKNKLLIVVLTAIIALVGCKGQKSDTDASSEVKNKQITPQPHTTTFSDSGESSDYSGEPKLEVTQSVAYLFSDMEGNQLYAACEYKNTSNCPCTVKSVNYTLNISGKDMEFSSEQPASRYCIIYPGKSFYHAVWKSYDCKKDDTVSVKSVSIDCEKSLDSCLPIEVDDIYMVQNYPKFATVSGRLHSAKENASLNEIAIGFYDGSDKLLGVWYFTDSSELAANKTKHFTTHLRSLPIEGLAEKAVTIKAFGFGFNAS